MTLLKKGVQIKPQSNRGTEKFPDEFNLFLKNIQNSASLCRLCPAGAVVKNRPFFR